MGAIIIMLIGIAIINIILCLGLRYEIRQSGLRLMDDIDKKLK